jgi:dTDP-glucose 4,6-dehydratase
MPARITDDDIRSALRGRPVLVTGADGMVGSHLCEKLLELGARVHVFVRATSSGGLHNLANAARSIVVHRGDLTDKQAIVGALKALATDGGGAVIFHIGAQAHVGESWARPYETVASTALGTLNLLQSIVDVGLDVHRLDVAGSSEEYGNVRRDSREAYRFGPDGGVILDEQSPLNPQSIYATSKLFADFITRNFWSAYGVPGVITRMFNNYGPRQNPRFITGTIITQALCRDSVRLGYVGAKRDFCFVKDGVIGHLHATLFGSPGEVYVYGYGQNVTILEWYELIIRIGHESGHWGERRLEADTAGRARLGNSEVEELRVDYSKLHQLTGWRPTHSWEDGLRETIRWYAENQDRWVHRVDWQ